MKSSRKHLPRSLQFEPLEAREVMAASVTASLSGSGVLTVTGSDSDDLINFRQIGKNISIVGVSGSWTQTKVKSIVVDLKGGNDTVSINSLANGGTKALAESVTVKAGSGNEKVQLADNQEVNFSGTPNTLSISAAGVASMNGLALNFGSSIVPSYKSGVLTITGTNSGDNIKLLQSNGWIGIQGRTNWWDATKVKSIILHLQEGNDFISLASLANGGNQELATNITINSGQGSQIVRLANGFDVNLSGWGHQLKVSTAGAVTLDGQTLNFNEDIQTSVANGVLTITGKSMADSIKLLKSNGWIGIQGRTNWWDETAISSIVVNLRGGDDAISLDSLSNGGNQEFSTPFTINSGDGNETVRLANGQDVTFSGTGHELKVSAAGTVTLDGQTLDFTDDIQTSVTNGVLTITGTGTADNIKLLQSNGWIGIQGRTVWWATSAINSIVVNLRGGNDAISLDSLSNGGNQAFNTPFTINSGDGNEIVRLANGHDVTFSGTGHQLTVNASGTVALDGQVLDFTGGNNPPIAVNDTFTTNEDTAVSTTVLSNDSDLEGNPLTITKVNGVSIVAGGAAVAVTNGTVRLNAAGTQLTFTPAANFNGSVSYTYTISDGQGGTNTATVSGTVTPVNDAPIAVNDTFTTNEDTAVSTTVLSNDSDLEGNPLTITKVNGTSIVAGGAAVAVTNGTVRLNAAGTQLTFTPTANFNGSVSYTYTISDGQGGTSTATVSGTVTPVDDPPIGTNWFDTNIQDAALRSLGHNLYLDGIIDRSDILALLRNTEDGGIIDGTELADLRKIVTTTTLVGTQAQLLKLTSYIVNGSVANAKYQGSTLGNLAAGSAYSHLDKLINKWFLGLDRPTAGGTYRQFAGQLFVNGATYDDVRQGSVGDCYFVSVLGEVAFRTPSIITNMFIVNGDGTYTVRFYNPQGQMDFVTVDSYLPSDGNGRLFYSTRGAHYTNTANELWVALAEKAYAQLNELGFSRAGFVESGQNTYAGISGGYVYAAMNHITGLSTVAFTMTSSSNSFSAFVTAYNAGKMIGFATYASPPTSGVVGNHAYAVVGYNATNQTVTLFNPWGIEYGLLTMTWSQITANFMYYDRTA